MLTASAEAPSDFTTKIVTDMNQTTAAIPQTFGAPLGLEEGTITNSKIQSPSKGLFVMRSGSQSAATEKAVLTALRWLKANQELDGSWKCSQNPPSGTALAVLAFLGHGETPDSQEFGRTVSKGLLYLAQHVDTNGLITGVSQDYIGYGYSQGPAILALSEGYAVTQSAILREPLDRALQAVFRQQAAAKSRQQDMGGWRNQSSPNDSDVPVTGWMIMALKSAQSAGIEISQDVFDKAAQYLWNMYDVKNPGFGYQTPKRYPTTTAVGVFCQQLLGNGNDPRLQGALNYLREQKVDWAKAEGDFILYGWYFMTEAMFQSGGSYRQYWDGQIRDMMLKNQKADGHWMPPPRSTIERNDLAETPAYSTALGVLILEVN